MTTNLLDSVAKVDESITNATTAKDVTQELLLVASPLMQCEDMLLPAPLAITLAAKLILISNNNDFALTKKEGGYKYLHWTSFRAAFAEVAHGLQKAFRVANKNMQEICIKSNTIPKEFNRAVVIMQKAPVNEVSDVLKISLDQIKSATDTCLQLAKEVEDNFILVTNMSEELLEATLDKEKETQGSLKEIEKKKQGILEAEKLAGIRKKENETRLKELEKKVNDADLLFKDTFNESDKLVMRMAITENITQVLKSGISNITPLLAINNMSAAASAIPTVLQAFGGYGTSKQQTNGSNELKQFEEITAEEAKESNKHNAKISAYSKAEYMLDLAQKLLEFIDDGDKIGDDAISAQNDQSYKQMFQELKRSLSEPAKHSKNANNALNLCAKGWTICDKINMIRQNSEKVDKPKLVDEIKKLYKECKEFACKSQSNLGGCNSLNKIGTADEKTKTNNSGLVNAAVNHAHFKLERSLEYLKCKQEEFDKAQDERKQLLDEMAKRAEEIQNLNIDEIDYKNVRDCLVKGLKVLGDLRNQWEYLVQYFQNMSTLIRMASNTSDKFRLLAEQDVKSVEKSQYLREFVYDEAFEAVKLAVIVRQLSKTYNEISQKFLTPQVGALDLFFNARDQNEQIAANRQLLQNQTEARIGIQGIIDNSKSEFAYAMNTRRMQLQSIKDSLEPLMSFEEKQENKKCAQNVSFPDKYDEDITNLLV